MPRHVGKGHVMPSQGGIVLPLA